MESFPTELVISALILFVVWRIATGWRGIKFKVPKTVKNKPPAREVGSPFLKLVGKHEPMITERWDAMRRQVETGQDFGFETWRYDMATERQIDKLFEEGAPESLLNEITKGQASDLIALTQPGRDPAGFLAFFKEWKRGMSDLQVIEAIRRLHLDESAMERWDNRPPVPFQKVIAAVCGIKFPKGATHADADRVIEEFVGEDDDRQTIVDTIEETMIDINDPELRREEFYIRKPSQKQLITVFKSLGLKNLAEGMVDAVVLAEKLIEEFPEIEVDPD